jgi:hypothetical protein
LAGGRFFAAWLSLHALLLQLLLPAFHHPEHVFASRAALAASLLAFADAGALPIAHHEQGGDHKQAPSCPLCLSLQHAQAFVPPASPALIVPLAQHAPVQLASGPGRVPRITLAVRARAPPASPDVI